MSAFSHSFPPRASSGQAELILPRGEAPGSRTLGTRVEQFFAMPSTELRTWAAARQEEAFLEFRQAPDASSLAINDVKDSQGCGEDRRSVRRAANSLLCQLGGRHAGLSMAWLMAHEVMFHNDSDHAQASCSLVWHIAGPAKACDFPGLGIGYVTRPGDAILFDSAQPHGVRLPGAAGQVFRDHTVVRQPPVGPKSVTVYLALDLPWTRALEQRLGVRRRSENAPPYGALVDGNTGVMDFGNAKV